jgi:hypothetical protein
MAGYYRKFVQHFAILAHPLTDLLKKGSMFVWTPAHDTAFIAIKQALITAPVLALPDFSKQFQIQTDASDIGVGTVLLQNGHPLAFISKALGAQTWGFPHTRKSISQSSWQLINGGLISNMASL